MIVNIANKVVVITGSSKGIGRELAKAFAKEKAKVVINYCNSEEKAKALHKEISTYNPNCLLLKADVTNPDEVSHMYHKTIGTFGMIDVLINNAGICDDNNIQLMPLKQWQSIIDVNLTGMFLCSREFSKAMIKQRYGKIINIASLKGQEGCAGQVNYSASKAGIIGFSKALAKELGQYNIAVNTVCPGFVVTDLNRYDSYKKEIAQKRSVLNIDNTMSDLVNFITFLASSCINGVSGREFNLDSRLL